MLEVPAIHNVKRLRWLEARVNVSLEVGRKLHPYLRLDFAFRIVAASLHHYDDLAVEWRKGLA